MIRSALVVNIEGTLSDPGITIYHRVRNTENLCTNPVIKKAEERL